MLVVMLCCCVGSGSGGRVGVEGAAVAVLAGVGGIAMSVGGGSCACWRSSSLTCCGGSGPVSSSRSFIMCSSKERLESLRALMSSSDGDHDSKPVAERNCSTLTSVLEFPDRTQASR